jgi:hypothetical protein
MGQAKERKASDPNYGRPKLPSVRGLIISAPTSINNTDISIAGQLDSQDIRFSLLFWDRLCWPSLPVVIGGDDDTAYLESVGILHRPSYPHFGLINNIVLETQAEAFKDLNKSSPGAWAFSQGANSVSVADGLLDHEGGALLSLLSAIPIPKADVSLADILEFKQKRRPELLAFREHFDRMIQEITNSSDQEAALTARRKEVDEACQNLRTVAKEWQFPFYLSDYSATFNFDIAKAMKAGKAGWEAGSTHSESSAAIAAAFGALASQFKITGAPKFRPARLPSSPYKYAYNIKNEL